MSALAEYIVNSANCKTIPGAVLLTVFDCHGSQWFLKLILLWPDPLPYANPQLTLTRPHSFSHLYNLALLHANTPKVGNSNLTRSPIQILTRPDIA